MTKKELENLVLILNKIECIESLLKEDHVNVFHSLQFITTELKAEVVSSIRGNLEQVLAELKSKLDEA